MTFIVLLYKQQNGTHILNLKRSPNNCLIPNSLCSREMQECENCLSHDFAKLEAEKCAVVGFQNFSHF